MHAVASCTSFCEKGELQRITKAVEYIHHNLNKPVSVEGNSRDGALELHRFLSKRQGHDARIAPAVRQVGEAAPGAGAHPKRQKSQ